MRALCLCDSRGCVMPRVQYGLPSCSGERNKASHSESSPPHCCYLCMASPVMGGHLVSRSLRRAWTLFEPRHHRRGSWWPLHHHAIGCMQNRLKGPHLLLLSRSEFTRQGHWAKVARARWKHLRLLRRRGSPATRSELSQLLSYMTAWQDLKEEVVSILWSSIVSLF